MKVGLRFPLHKMLVEVLKRFEIYLHQLTPRILDQNQGFHLGNEEPGVTPQCHLGFLSNAKPRIIILCEPK
jgi:hypothetical protein